MSDLREVADAVVRLVEERIASEREDAKREALQEFIDNGVYGERWKVEGHNEGYARALADTTAAIEAHAKENRGAIWESDVLAVVRRLAE